jgi:hypothetical protein
MTRMTRILLAAMIAFGMANLRVSAQDASLLPTTNPSVVFKTMVPHRNSIVSKPAIELPGEENESASPFLGFSGTPYTVGATITPTTTVPEAEEHIAVDPSNFNHLISMISDFSQNGGFNTSKFAFSTNNGASWTEHFVPTSGGFPQTSDGHIWQANSDPVVAVDKLGNVFLSNLYLQVSGQFVTNDGLYVCAAKLFSGGKFTASTCHPVRTTLNASVNLEDKNWIAVDNSSSSFSGNVYSSWTHFTATSSMIFFSRSTNHGVSWSKAIQINPASQNGAIQGSQVAVGPAGEIYVAYEVFLGTTGAQGQHFIAKSTNGGVSFGTPVPMTPIFTNLHFAAHYRDNSFPALAVAPVAGKAFIYDVYTDQPGANARTAFVHSKTSGGLTFTAPISANDSTKGQRLMPAVAADTQGVVHISWFDTRNSTTTANLDIFATFTENNGSSFAPNAKVTSAQIKTTANDFIGDYSGIAAEPNGATRMAHPAWTSAGLNENGRLQTATLTVP